MKIMNNQNLSRKILFADLSAEVQKAKVKIERLKKELKKGRNTD